MSAPRLARFKERLAETLSAARERRALSAREYEAMLVDPDFDDAEFERFRAEAESAGIALPEDESEPAALSGQALAGEPERDLLELYLDEIGRHPLMSHDELIA